VLSDRVEGALDGAGEGVTLCKPKSGAEQGWELLGGVG